MTQSEKEEFANMIGMALGSMIPVIHAFPPTSKEATKETILGLQIMLGNSAGIPPEAKSFINGAISMMVHWTDHPPAVTN
ncbi:MAG: hypothetical protein ACTS9Y_13455 [Methylophilus sp.]|uniref:hypothetical protein n=1 Tax=Methylophilus sp. TaxID=29541 RepID=UPI003F9FB04E